jgi:uncharacterized protein YdaU (DUF1376 family)
VAQKDVPEWFSFYPYDFMGDENVIAMTLEERGAYITLLCRQWANGSIPADVPALARILKRTTTEMEMLWPAVSPCFPGHPVLENRLANTRLELERELTIKRIKGASKGGKTAAENRRRSKLTSTGEVVDLDRSSTPEVVNPYVMYCSNNKESKSESQDAKWGEFRSLYPAHRLDEEPALRAWLSREGEADAILAGTRLWVASDDWTADGGKWVKWASGFISNGIYKTRPKDPGADAHRDHYKECD